MIFNINSTRGHTGSLLVYTIIGRSLVNICKGLEPRKCRPMNARSRPFLPK